MADQHDEILQHLRIAYGERYAANIPSKVAAELGMRFSRYEEKKMLQAIMPALDRFASAVGAYQTGMIGAATDTVVSALATLLAARPCSIVTAETTNLRPLAADGKVYKVEARIRALRNSMVFVEARAEDWEGRTIAVTTATLAVYKSKRK